MDIIISILLSIIILLLLVIVKQLKELIYLNSDEEEIKEQVPCIGFQLPDININGEEDE